MDGSNSSEALDRFAAFYDLEYADYNEDVSFYLNYASIYRDEPDPQASIQSRKPQILELGCGTGRLLVPLARAGCEVVGVDASPAMLAIASDRLAAAGVSDCIPLTAEMSKANLPAGYRADLIIIALNTFQYLTSMEAQIATLRRLRPHLAEDGRLIIALPGPTIWPDQERLDNILYLQGSFAAPSGGTVQKWFTATYDPISQLQAVTFIYDEIQSDGTLRRTLAPLTLRYTFRYEMEHLLAACGYHLERLYGSYELDPLTADSAHMIFVAQGGHEP
ncbi:MAG: class I SAM-dependent methyltransferase [Candidatus Chloroheliales bacterium]|nr:MAG: class I SAM-dependent methyltransferase [Chloroflexota bacterium]